jgi:hypothetical protein
LSRIATNAATWLFFQSWNTFGELSSSGMYAANTQMQMPLPQPSGMTQIGPGSSAQISSSAPPGANEMAKLHTPLAVQSPVQNPGTPMPAQPQSVNQWFGNALDSDVSTYEGISQVSTCKMPFFCVMDKVGAELWSKV